MTVDWHGEVARGVRHEDVPNEGGAKRRMTLPTTVALIEQLHAEGCLHRLCGFGGRHKLPASEAQASAPAATRPLRMACIHSADGKSASAHASQVAIPLATMTAARVIGLAI